MGKHNSKPRREKKQTHPQFEDQTVQPNQTSLVLKNPSKPREANVSQRGLGSNYDILCQALELTQSEHDEHSNTIKDVLKKPKFDVNVGYPETAPLHVAFENAERSLVGVKLLLADARCDVNLRDNRGSPILMRAVERAESTNDVYAQIIQFLLAHRDTDVNFTQNRGTALHVACEFKSQVGVQLLLSSTKCDVSLTDGRGDTAFMTVVRNVNDIKHANIIRLFLAHPDIDINEKDSHDRTSLHRACHYKNPVTTQLLLSDERCDVDFRDIDGETPDGGSSPGQNARRQFGNRYKDFAPERYISHEPVELSQQLRSVSSIKESTSNPGI